MLQYMPAWAFSGVPHDAAASHWLGTVSNTLFPSYLPLSSVGQPHMLLKTQHSKLFAG
jgi:hypothetical protein